MKPKDGTKKLTLRKETLRRLPRELAEQQLVRALGGGDGGAFPIIVPTTRSGDSCDTVVD